MSRNLNTNEYFSWVISRASPHNFVCILEVMAHLEQNKVENVLDILVSTTPLLQYSFNDSCPNFVKLENPAITLSSLKNLDWQKEAEVELTIPFNSSSSLLRVKSIENKNSTCFLFTFHHGIADAYAGYKLIQRFINLCFDVQEDFDPDKLLIPDLVHHYPDVNKINVGHKKIKKNDRQTGFIALSIDAQQTSFFEDYLDKNPTISFNSFIGAIFIEAMVAILKIENNEKIRFNTPVNLHASNKDLAFVNSWLECDVDNFNDVVQVASHITKEIREKLKAGEYIETIKELTKVCSESTVEKILSNTKRAQPVIFVTGFKAIAIRSPASKKIIKNFNMIVNCQAFLDSAKSLVIVYTKQDGKLFFNIEYVKDLIDIQSIKDIASFVSEKISLMCSRTNLQ